MSDIQTQAQIDAAAAAAAALKVAQDDLVTLQAAAAILTNPASTLAQIQAEIAALPGLLGDPGRIVEAQAFPSNIQSLFNNLANLIAETSHAAGLS